MHKEQTEPKISAEIRLKAEIRLRLGRNRTPIYQFRFRPCRNRNLITNFGFNRKFRPKLRKEKQKGHWWPILRNLENYEKLWHHLFLIMSDFFIIPYFLIMHCSSWATRELSYNWAIVEEEILVNEWCTMGNTLHRFILLQDKIHYICLSQNEPKI